MHLSTAQCAADTERELPSGPLECASLMNSSVAQLIAIPATVFYQRASSPRDPAAGLAKRGTVCIPQLAEGGLSVEAGVFRQT